jgi:hypothetical protein
VPARTALRARPDQLAVVVGVDVEHALGDS